MDLRLVPLPSLNVTSISTNLIAPPTTSQNTQLTFTAVGRESTRYYKYWVASGYQTSDYGNWQLVKDWSFDTSVTWSPPGDGHYVLVAWVTDDPSSEIFQQAGLSVETRGNRPHPVVIKELTTDMSFPQSSGTMVTLTTKAAGGSGPLLYRYWYKKEGGSWQMIRDYAASSSCSWTPAEDGGYTVVVWVTDDPSVGEPPIIGLTCTIGD